MKEQKKKRRKHSFVKSQDVDVSVCEYCGYLLGEDVYRQCVNDGGKDE